MFHFPKTRASKGVKPERLTPRDVVSGLLMVHMIKALKCAVTKRKMSLFQYSE